MKIRRMRPRSVIAAAVIGASATLVAGQAVAQGYPSKPITVIVGYPPGGGLDVLCRMVLAGVTAKFGHSLVVQNRPGADGHIGLTAVATAPPDGYTISCVPHSMTQSVHMKPLSADILKDLAPVVQMVTWNWTFLVRADSPAKTWPEFVALAKSSPGKITFGTSGAAARLTGALLESRAGISLNIVPFKGAAPAVTALLGGHIDSTVASVVESLAQTKAGKARALAVLAPERVAIAPDLPAITEHYPGFDPSAWYGIVAPAATPRDIVERLNGQFAAVLNDPPFKQQLADRGFYAKTGTPEQFRDLIRMDWDRYGKVIKQYDVK